MRLALSHDDTHPEANYWLGFFYEQGLGVELNHQIAWKYYEKSSSAYNYKALTKLGHLSYSGVKRQEFMDSDPRQYDQNHNDAYMYARLPDKMEAVHYYLKAANFGKDAEAFNCLGLIYELGLGLDIVLDPKQASSAGLGPSRDNSRERGANHSGGASRSSSNRRGSMRDSENSNRGIIKACMMYEQALKYEPSNADSLFNLGIL